MVFRNCWRRLKVMAASLPMRRKTSFYPVFLYRDSGQGDIDQGMRLVGGRFRIGWHDYFLPYRGGWQGNWPPEVKRWLYSFVWLRDLHALGSHEARLAARTLISAWAENAPNDSIAQEGPVMGMRLASWLGHYEFCLMTATEETQRRVMEVIRHEGRILAALLPLSPQGWRGLAALRGLLAAFMAVPEQQGFFLRYQRYFPAEMERLILEDGMVADRSPEAQFQCVQELSCMMAMFSALQLEPPPLLPVMLAKTCPVLRALCHGDGKFAVFNGSNERSAEDIQALLDRAERYRVIATSLPKGGFVRLALGKSMLFVDATQPPARGFDRAAHAGTLSFEFSNQQNRIFVNCGACSEQTWQQGLRSSAAHNVLVADEISSSDFGADGHITRRPAHVECVHKSTEEAHWLDLSHDGYYPALGTVWSRQLYLGQNGEDLRGSDIVEGERDVRFVIRFHIHPDVRVVQEDDDVILYVAGEIWRFRQVGGVMSVEEDLYVGRGKPEKTYQIAVSSRGGRDIEADDEGVTKRRQKVTWLLERVPD
ncbi:heparinase [Saccharibacter sp. 17.LH.SD]|uniref:heparinase II/III family protein n=1 Tax=Saccharibacter sp. 17.LH.SD TaxID=2689393 RepID=UPI00136A00CA|nr:heparinase II/III family protein [Saccharibacter sp. 17.LH.SD]MXV43615.1 heparinase [Saccharibacter sp. 17.LH.SD]